MVATAQSQEAVLSCQPPPPASCPCSQRAGLVLAEVRARGSPCTAPRPSVQVCVTSLPGGRQNCTPGAGATTVGETFALHAAHPGLIPSNPDYPQE